jgi:hypothetical protein
MLTLAIYAHYPTPDCLESAVGPVLGAARTIRHFPDVQTTSVIMYRVRAGVQPSGEHWFAAYNVGQCCRYCCQSGLLHDSCLYPQSPAGKMLLPFATRVVIARALV